MAENKKSFIGYVDWLSIFEQLEDDEAGRLIKHFLRYVNDLNPEAPDKITRLVFEPIKQQLKRDLKKWEGTKINKSDGGRMGNLKRWHPDLHDAVITENCTLLEAEAIAKHRKASHTDDMRSDSIASIAVNDTVNVTVTDNVINKEENMAVSTAAPSDKDLKSAYSFLVKDVLTICGFIRQNKPKFIEPYMDLWNLFAQKKGKPTVKTITKKRQRHLKARLAEDEFSIEMILSKAKDSKFLMAEPFFTFDWIIESQDNYIKVLEGKYDKSYESGNQQTQGRNSTDRFKDIDEQFGQTGS